MFLRFRLYPSDYRHSATGHRVGVVDSRFLISGFLIILSGWLTGCGNGQASKENGVSQKNGRVRVIVNDTIPMERTEISKQAVAGYTAKVPDPLNDFVFSVRLFETPLRFRYRADIRYKMMTIKDSVDIPNFGHQPRVDIRRHEGELSCMIGFYDENGVFKDLKKVEVRSDQVKIVQVKRYGRGTVIKK